MDNSIIINKDIEINHFEQWPLDFLCDYLANSHHVYLRKKIRQLISECIPEGTSENGRLLIERLKEIDADFEIHMNKEEKFLFPYIKNLVKLTDEKKNYEIPPFGGLNGPAAVLRKEHEAATKNLERLLNDFQFKGKSRSEPFQKQLSDFSGNLAYHIEIENNLLFPRALSLEKKLKNKSKTKNILAS